MSVVIYDCILYKLHGNRTTAADICDVNHSRSLIKLWEKIKSYIFTDETWLYVHNAI